MQYHWTCNTATDLVSEKGLSYLSRNIGIPYVHFLVNLDISTARIEQLRDTYRHVDHVILYALVEWSRHCDHQGISRIQQVNDILKALEDIDYNGLVEELVQTYNITGYQVPTHASEQLNREEHDRQRRNYKDSGGMMLQEKMHEIPRPRIGHNESYFNDTADAHVIFKTQSHGRCSIHTHSSGRGSLCTQISESDSLGSCSELSNFKFGHSESMGTQSSGIGSMGSYGFPNPYTYNASDGSNLPLQFGYTKPSRRPSLNDYCFIGENEIIKQSENDQSNESFCNADELDEFDGRELFEHHEYANRKLSHSSSCSSKRLAFQPSKEDLVARQRQNSKLTSRRPSLFDYKFDDVTEDEKYADVPSCKARKPTNNWRISSEPNSNGYIDSGYKELSTASTSCSSSDRSASPSSDDHFLPRKTRNKKTPKYSLKEKKELTKTSSLLNKLTSLFKRS